jgi:pyrroline-5-carboxylate reductase
MKFLSDLHFAIIGAGNIGQMLLEKLLTLHVPANQLSICDLDADRAKTSAALAGCNVFELTDLASCQASVWLLSVGPMVTLPVLQTLSNHLKPGHIIVSFAAAVPIRDLEEIVPKGVSVIRVMPNMPSLIGQGMNPLCFSPQTTNAAREIALELLKQLGETVEVRDDQMNWCVGLSGAAMRSILPAIEGMIHAGVDAGLSQEVARLLAAQVVLGTAGLVKQSSLSLDEIKKLTPMATLDETQLEQLFYDAAVGAKEKIDKLQTKISGGG